MRPRASGAGHAMTLFHRANPARRAFARRSVSSPLVTVPEAPVRRPALVVVDDEPTVLRVGHLYGPAWTLLNHQTPISRIFAVGSEVTVSLPTA